MPNPSALILPMEPQPPEGTNLIEWNMVNKAFVPWEWERGPTYSGGSRTGKPIHCQHRIGDKVKAGDKTLLVRTVEARRVDSLTEEELTGLARHGAGQAWVWFLKGESVKKQVQMNTVNACE